MAEFCAKQHITCLWSAFLDGEFEVKGTGYKALSSICTEKIPGMDVEDLIRDMILHLTDEYPITCMIKDFLYINDLGGKSNVEVVMARIAKKKGFDMSLSQVNVFARSYRLQFPLFAKISNGCSHLVVDMEVVKPLLEGFRPKPLLDRIPRQPNYVRIAWTEQEGLESPNAILHLPNLCLSDTLKF